MSAVVDNRVVGIVFFINYLITWRLFFLVVQSMSQEDNLDWEWRSQFSKVSSDLAKSIEIQLHLACDACTTTLPSSAQQCNSQGMDMVDVNPALIGGRLDYPRKTAKVCLVASKNRLFEYANISLCM